MPLHMRAFVYEEVDPQTITSRSAGDRRLISFYFSFVILQTHRLQQAVHLGVLSDSHLFYRLFTLPGNRNKRVSAEKSISRHRKDLLLPDYQAKKLKTDSLELFLFLFFDTAFELFIQDILQRDGIKVFGNYILQTFP